MGVLTRVRSWFKRAAPPVVEAVAAPEPPPRIALASSTQVGSQSGGTGGCSQHVVTSASATIRGHRVTPM